jgi:hypothetical protein
VVASVEAVDDTAPDSVWKPPDRPGATVGIDERGKGMTGGTTAGLMAGRAVGVVGEVTGATAPATAGTAGRLELTELSGDPGTVVADGMMPLGRGAAEAGRARAVKRTKPTRMPDAPPNKMRAVRRSVPCDRDGLPAASSNTGRTISTGTQLPRRVGSKLQIVTIGPKQTMSGGAQWPSGQAAAGISLVQ